MNYKPMHAKIGNLEDLDKSNFIFEPKLDGYRALCLINTEKRFFSRRGIDITKEYPEIQFNINCKNCLLDGEIVIFDKEGVPNFNLLQNHDGTANYIIFDILIYNNRDVTNIPLLKRKEILEKLKIEGENIEKITFTSEGKKLLRFAQEKKLEGIIAKKIESPYEQTRSSSWLKIKFNKTVDCIIIGYTTRKRNLSSILLGLYSKEKIIYVGKVGTGFNDEKIDSLLKLFDLYKQDNPIAFLKEKNIKWLIPKLVCEIKFSELTPNKKLRSPVFMRIRDDKSPRECTFSQFRIKKR